MTLGEIFDYPIIRSTVASMVTLLAGVLFASVSGFFGKIDNITDIKKSQDSQAMQVVELKAQVEKTKDIANDLKLAIVGFSAEHKFLIETVKELKDELAAARRAR
jgi:hypothetical protein